MIRPLQADDIAAVCALFSRTFRPGAAIRSDELAEAVRETYLTAPAYRPDRGSLVHVDEGGRINGFLGLINITLRLGERVLQAGVMSAYMADVDHKANPPIGLALVRAAQRLPLDLIFSDTANRTSLDISQALNFNVMPLQSLEWTKVLRPIGTGTYLLTRKRRTLGDWLARPAGALDAVLSRHPVFQVNDRRLKGTVSRPLTIERFVDGAAAFLDPSMLRPAWDAPELTWIVTQASRQMKSGTLHMREVVDRGGRVAGMYLVYARRGGVAVTLQLLARPGREEMVVGDMLHQAKLLGAVAVKGAGSAMLFEGLMRHQGVIYRHVMSCLVWAADPDVAAAIRGGRAQLGGLAGETWARIFADAFG
jgi:hypothetical protein